MARSGVIYGSTGTFKTTAVAHFARWIAETTGKSTLLFSSDGGGWDPAQEEVHAKMILPYHVDANTIPLPIIRKVSQGYWPRNPEEPDIAKVLFARVDWSHVGGIAVEGITSIGTMLMRHCADKNLKTGQEGTSSFQQPIYMEVYDPTIREPIPQVVYETFTQNSKGHYGFVQNQLYSLISNFISLPVSYVLFTAHEKRYTEDGELQVGIATPGKAITPLVPTWVGDCIHAQDFRYTEEIDVPHPTDPGKIAKESVVRVRCRYHFNKHIDPATNAVFDAKPRVTHSKAMALEKLFPGGFFVPTTEHGFDTYLRAVDKLAQDAAQSDSLKNWRAKADERRTGRKPNGEPGLPQALPSQASVGGSEVPK